MGGRDLPKNAKREGSGKYLLLDTSGCLLMQCIQVANQMSACKCANWCKAIWSLIEFDAQFDIQPGTQGSSGREVSNLSSWRLKVSTGQPLKFLNSFGSALNKSGPRMERKLKRIVCKAAVALEFRAFTKHNLPSLGNITGGIPSVEFMFGTKPSRIFHTYMSEYRSRLLSNEYSLNFFSLDQ